MLQRVVTEGKTSHIASRRSWLFVGVICVLILFLGGETARPKATAVSDAAAKSLDQVHAGGGRVSAISAV